MKILRLFLFAALFAFSTANIFAQEPQDSIVKVSLPQGEVDRIVKNFTAKEGEFRTALNSYAFNRNASISTIGLGGNITGTYRRDSFMTFDAEGKRFEKILYAPISTLTEISLTAQDLEDLGGVNPFALEPSVINLYNFKLLGKEKIDELSLYVFEVEPKVMPDPKKTKQRLFLGRVWVDDQDLQIVKSKGKGVPETKNDKYPVVETWRENVDGKYWFPTFSTSDDELVFNSGQVVKMRVRVKYANYNVGKSTVRILDDDETDESKPKPTPTPTPKKP